jgi:replicative DNA helicase
MTDDTHTLPNDALAEQYTLAAMIAAPRVVPAVQQVIQPGDFYQPRHETICAAIYRLDAAGEPVDGASVVKALRGDLSAIGGPAYIHDLLAQMPAPDAATFHAKTIARLAVQRRLIAAGTRLAQLGYAPDSTDDLPTLLAVAEAEVQAVASGAIQDSTAIRVGDVLDDYLEVLETGEEPPGIAFHTADLRRDLRPCAEAPWVSSPPGPASGRQSARSTTPPTQRSTRSRPSCSTPSRCPATRCSTGSSHPKPRSTTGTSPAAA